MAKPSMINPELFSYFQLIPEMKLKHSIPSSCDSAFNAQGLLKAVDFTSCNTQTQVTENYWSKKSSGIFHSDITRIYLILLDVIGDDVITPFHPVGSTNLSFIFGGSGRYGASLIPGTMQDPPVRKAADTQPRNDNEPDQNTNKSNDNGDGAVQPNNDAENIEADGGGDIGGGNGNGDGGNEGGNGDGNDAANNGVKQWSRPLKLHGYTWNLNDGPLYVPSRSTRLGDYAFEFDGWLDIALSFHVYYLKINEDYAYNEEVAMDPINCCPGCITFFGRLEADDFYFYDWVDYEWEAVKLLVTDVFVIRMMI